MPLFRDRTDAGKHLLSIIKQKEKIDPSNLFLAGIPNGGIPVAIPIAKYYKIPLFVLISRKVQYPWTTESGFGALTSDGIIVFNERALKHYNMSESLINIQIQKTKQEINERELMFEDYLLPKDLSNKTIILVDDGLASGITTRAAVLSLQNRKANKILVAVPTAHASSIDVVEKLSKKQPYCKVNVISPDIRGGWSFAVANAYFHWFDENKDNILNILSSYNQYFFKN